MSRNSPHRLPLGYAPSSNSLTILTKLLATFQSARRFLVQDGVPRSILTISDPSIEMVVAWFSARSPYTSVPPSAATWGPFHTSHTRTACRREASGSDQVGITSWAT